MREAWERADAPFRGTCPAGLDSCADEGNEPSQFTIRGLVRVVLRAFGARRSPAPLHATAGRVPFLVRASDVRSIWDRSRSRALRFDPPRSWVPVSLSLSPCLSHTHTPCLLPRPSLRRRGEGNVTERNGGKTTHAPLWGDARPVSPIRGMGWRGGSGTRWVVHIRHGNGVCPPFDTWETRGGAFWMDGTALAGANEPTVGEGGRTCLPRTPVVSVDPLRVMSKHVTERGRRPSPVVRIPRRGPIHPRPRPPHVIFLVLFGSPYLGLHAADDRIQHPQRRIHRPSQIPESLGYPRRQSERRRPVSRTRPHLE